MDEAKDFTRSISPKTVPEGEGDEADEDLTQDDVDQRIRVLDDEIEISQKRLAEIELEKQEHQRQIKLHSAMVPRVSDIKSEVADETEEDADTTETPLEEDKLVYIPPQKQTRVISPRKRARPLSEIEEDRENIRVRIWRTLKAKTLEELQLEKFTVTTISTENLNIIERVEDISGSAELDGLHRASRHAIFRTLRARQKRHLHQQEQLRSKYRQRYNSWQEHMNKLDAESERQRNLEMERLGISPPKVEQPTPVEGPPGTPGVETADPLSAASRGTRRAQQAAHARDYVQSEAEFLELMASLGTEEKDHTAKIPPMLPPDERFISEFDENSRVIDPVAFYMRSLFTVEEGSKIDIRGWTDEEVSKA